MTDQHHSPTSLLYLEAVSKLRYSLSVVAELLYTQLTAERQQQYTHDALLLLEEAKRCCFIPQLNEDEAGPAVYLVKLLMRQYGPSFLSRVCDHTELLWVVPEHLRQTDEVPHGNFNYITHATDVTHTHAHMRTHTHTHTHMLAHIHTYTHTHTHTNTHTHTCTRTHKLTHRKVRGWTSLSSIMVIVDFALHW